MFLVGYVVAARLTELGLSLRNTRHLLAAGAHEVGRRHYPVVVLFQISWIISLRVMVPDATPPMLLFLALFVLVQIVRFWTVRSLGERWTTRIIVVPGRKLITDGPYRWVRHPSYLVVAGEIALLPLVFGAWKLALGFSIVNAILLSYRIRVEERALAPHQP